MQIKHWGSLWGMSENQPALWHLKIQFCMITQLRPLMRPGLWLWVQPWVSCCHRLCFLLWMSTKPQDYFSSPKMKQKVPYWDLYSSLAFPWARVHPRFPHLNDIPVRSTCYQLIPQDSPGDDSAAGALCSRIAAFDSSGRASLPSRKTVI